jgi:hypothetical protein
LEFGFFDVCVRELLLILTEVVCGVDVPWSSEDASEYVEEGWRETIVGNLREDRAHETWIVWSFVRHLGGARTCDGYDMGGMHGEVR